MNGPLDPTDAANGGERTLDASPRRRRGHRRTYSRHGLTTLRAAVRALGPRVSPYLPHAIADVVTFLFFCPWRVGAARRLEWRDYSEADPALTLRPELNKTGHELRIPVGPREHP